MFFEAKRLTDVCKPKCNLDKFTQDIQIARAKLLLAGIPQGNITSDSRFCKKYNRNPRVEG